MFTFGGKDKVYKFYKVFLCPGHHTSECRLGISVVFHLKLNTFVKAELLQTFTVTLDKINKSSQKSQNLTYLS